MHLVSGRAFSAIDSFLYPRLTAFLPMMDFSKKTPLQRHLQSQLPESHIVQGDIPSRLVLRDKNLDLARRITDEVRRFYEGQGHSLESIRGGFAYRSGRPGTRHIVTIKQLDGQTLVETGHYNNLNK
jgi:hypothetical protein